MSSNKLDNLMEESLVLMNSAVTAFDIARMSSEVNGKVIVNFLRNFKRHVFSLNQDNDKSQDDDLAKNAEQFKVTKAIGAEEISITTPQMPNSLNSLSQGYGSLAVPDKNVQELNINPFDDWKRQSDADRQLTFLVFATLGTFYNPAAIKGMLFDEKVDTQVLERVMRAPSTYQQISRKFLFLLDTIYQEDLGNIEHLEFEELDELVDSGERRWETLYALLRKPSILRTSYVDRLKFQDNEEIIKEFPLLRRKFKGILKIDLQKPKKSWLEHYLKFLAANEGKSLDYDFVVSKVFEQESGRCSDKIDGLLEEISCLKADCSKAQDRITGLEGKLRDAREIKPQIIEKEVVRIETRKSPEEKQFDYLTATIERFEKEIIPGLDSQLSVLTKELRAEQKRNEMLNSRILGMCAESDLLKTKLSLARHYTGKSIALVSLGKEIPKSYVDNLNELGVIAEPYPFKEIKLGKLNGLSSYDLVMMISTSLNHKSYDTIKKVVGDKAVLISSPIQVYSILSNYISRKPL